MVVAKFVTKTRRLIESRRRQLSREPQDLKARETRILAEIFQSAFIDDELLELELGATRSDLNSLIEAYTSFELNKRPTISHFFHKEFYSVQYSDINSRQTNLDPLVHFFEHGFQEGRQPHPLIDFNYLKSKVVASKSEQNDLDYLCKCVLSNIASPTPYFDLEYYAAMRSIPIDDESCIFLDYIKHGQDKLSPNRLFDPFWYIGRYPDVEASHLSSICHFVIIGDGENRRPSSEFDSEWYRNSYGDLRQVRDIKPLYHYLRFGRREGRIIRSPSIEESIARPSDLADRYISIPIHPGMQNIVAVEEPSEVLLNYQTINQKITAQKWRSITDFKERTDLLPSYDDTGISLSQLRSLTSDRAPEISIIIPCFNEYEYTLDCILSVVKHPPETSWELIIADDASTDLRTQDLGKIQGLRVVRQSENIGFLRNCNAAFKTAQGTYVMLLNNDTQVTAGAINHLVDTIRTDPRVGVVGPKILYPNGRLQEAGCRIDADGSTKMIGLFDNPAKPEYNWSRFVDYCSGAAVVFRRSDIEGDLFDIDFVPAYCEDVDLCLRLSAKSLRTFYDARATVFHHLSVSTGKDSEVKRVRLATRNQHKILTKWKDSLRSINQIRMLAFYLPQFHPLPENDLWWGKGFTEWTNVTRAAPSYAGHYQPHLPADLGFYDLRTTEVMGQQFELASRYGIEGFCVYYYNFNGKRMLNRPMDALLENPSIPFRFCMCWANENWTKNWDGGNKEILLQQDYTLADLRTVADDFAKYASDARYIAVDGKPLFLIYRPMIIPNVSEAISLLRTMLAERGYPNIHLVYVESMESVNAKVAPRSIGFDACVEFPPQGVAVSSTRLTPVIKPGWSGIRYDYQETIASAISREGVSYARYPGVFPSWDNTPRQPLKATSFDRVSPEFFQVFVENKINQAKDTLPAGERFVFVNAWNEWAEGAHLEPDQAYGHRWLTAIRNAYQSTMTFPYSP